MNQPTRSAHVLESLEPRGSQTPWARFRFGQLSKKWKVIAGVVVAVVLAIFIYQYIQTRNELQRASDPQAASQQEAKKLAGEVGKFLELPKGEAPSVATVKNADQLQANPFFKNAENGDKVLIYAEASKAVIYRPSTKKVIEYAPVGLNGPEDAAR